MAQSVSITNRAARQLALRAQLLAGRPALPEGKAGVADTIQQLGYVQIDTIAVIERAHHHTLWTRRPDYDPSMLHELQAVDRKVFEYWGHAASYLPMQDYRFCLPRMRRYYDVDDRWLRRRIEQCQHLLEPVLERIRREGPLTSKDFDLAPGASRGDWWDWKPTKIALEILFSRGELMVSERRNFQRVYDLTERVLPSHVDTTFPTDEEVGRFLVRRALNAYGTASEREIQDHIRGAPRPVISAALQELVSEEEAVHVIVEGETGPGCFALTSVLEETAVLPVEPPALHLLSPFDNLIIQRKRTSRLFDFGYTLECYVPAAKRRYGYFVLPILWGDRLVGRLDPKADRRRKVLQVRNLVLELGVDASDDLPAALAVQLRRLARFNACQRVVIERASAPGLRERLTQVLAQG